MADLVEIRKINGRSTLCIQCGPIITVDEDGCCASCGCQSMGFGADYHRETVQSLLDHSAESFESGYLAALYSDLPSYLSAQRPWWCPRWIWARGVRRSFAMAYDRRGDDL